MIYTIYRKDDPHGVEQPCPGSRCASPATSEHDGVWLVELHGLDDVRELSRVANTSVRFLPMGHTIELGERM